MTILSITSCVPVDGDCADALPVVFGLGSDGNVYRWQILSDGARWVPYR